MKYVYSSLVMVDVSALPMMHISPMYAPERNVIYVKCESICFWLNAVHHFISDHKKKGTEEADNE